jgi:hypothetical protein
MTKRTVLLATATVIIGCSTTSAPSQPDFGAHFRVTLQPDPPVLTAASLAVTVSYGACGDNREFLLEYHSRSATEVEVWLRKITPDESCRMLVTERRVFATPESVRAAAVVTFLRPEDNAYQLRP